MFKKLISRFQDTKASDHPLASDASLNALMADIPESDPRRLLFDIDEQLAGMEAAVREIGPTLALRALARLDQFSRPSARYLLSRYLSVGEREYLTDSVWSALDTHAGHQFRCYRSFLLPTLELPTENKPLVNIDLTGRKRVPDQWQPDWIVKKYFGDAPQTPDTAGQP